MPRPLPLRANLEWLRKRAKERLEALRQSDPSARLSIAQLDVAREHGFPSWRKLKASVEEIRRGFDSLVPQDGAVRQPADQIPPDDPELGRLFSAIAAGERAAVADLIVRRPALASATGTQGITPLHAAAQCNDPTLAALLVAHGADVEARYGRSGHTPLTWAVTCNAPECARTLLRLGARPDLFSAAGLGDLDHVRACFDDSGRLIAGSSRTGSSRFGPDGARLPCPPSVEQEQVSDALAFACRNGQAGIVAFLLGRSPDLAFRAFMGATPLHWAYFGGSREAVSLLLGAGADPNVRDDALRCVPRAFGICAPASWGLTFLVRARLEEDPALARFMDGRTSALHEAARSGQAEVVRQLLEHGADAAIADGEGRLPLELAIEAGHDELSEIFRTASASPPG